MNLPDSFLQSMKDLMGDEADELFASIDKKSVSGLRINTSKISCEDFERNAPYFVEKIPFLSDGYYINDSDAWSRHPFYFAGLYYLQEPSAMLPVNTLGVDSSDRVLDLCAAPGGKSCAIAAKKPAVLISNDISPSRAIPLVFNLEHTGTYDHAVTVEDPAILAGHYEGMFDKIFVDAPCSGEGMFRRDTNLIRSYIQRGPSYYRPIQTSILENAYRMLAGNGQILYSTCTYSDIEDEQVVIDFLAKHPDMHIIPIEKSHGLSPVYEKYRTNDEITGCVHAFCHRFRGEGHFMALIKKDALPSPKKDIGFFSEGLMRYDNIPKGAKDLCSHISQEFATVMKNSAFLIRNDTLYMISEGTKPFYDKNIRFARTGLSLGRMNRAGKFTPGCALALALKVEEFDNVLDFRPDDPGIIKYLKGETLVCGSSDAEGAKPEKGYVLICADSYPLGFAAFDGVRYRNLYEKGWRYI